MIIKTPTEVILADAISTYGYHAQVRMAVEELSELIKALCKHERKPCEMTRQAILEELADVQIMLWQMEMVFCSDDELGNQIEFKIKRLEKKLNGA
jgi:hypothetical protein